MRVLFYTYSVDRSAKIIAVIIYRPTLKSNLEIEPNKNMLRFSDKHSVKNIPYALRKNNMLVSPYSTSPSGIEAC